MSSTEFKPGLEGVVAFETEIAEPDREGGALRYRGVDIEELVGSFRFEQVWGLLVDESFSPGLPAAEPYEGGGLTGNTPADLQAVTARLGAEWGVKKLIDITDDEAREDLRRLSAQFISIAAQSARIADGNDDRIAPQAVAQGETTAERFFLEWRGEADAKHVQALDTYWICTCEHGLNASTFVARITASTGSDCAAALSSAVGALSGPLHGGAPARVLPMLDAAAESGDPAGYVQSLIERGERLMGFGHRVYRAEDPRARLLKKTAQELGAPRYDVAERLEQAALEALRKKSPDRPLETNVEFWSAVVGAIGALSGPLHGGAPSRALDMLDAIGTPDKAEAWIRDSVMKGERIMGFGHRIYKTDDPRSVMLRGVAERLGGDMVDFAKKVEKTVVEVLAELKPGRNLYANVEFYAGVVMDKVGLPRTLFTPTFTSSRVIGWTAHILEQAADNRLIRPSAHYAGPPPPQPVPDL